MVLVFWLLIDYEYFSGFAEMIVVLFFDDCKKTECLPLAPVEVEIILCRCSA
jgi:hypothetical protein